ncbi:hypothetical protein [Candidatus Magnetobacterium casense]|uniref:Uncharacterized protein n=1 Tax=Candidatus Magnetobacterium casense TaxID=1455061 RepID=A0ABS6S0P9_9BACT|nr:hypothetical protein [Candidatus Magnetobacterium casensis]MBV6342419.1 hypothetical protein [Candidatus Magnetobacterium casensis]
MGEGERKAVPAEGLMGEYKKFSEELYRENDQKAKETAVHFLESLGRYKLVTPLERQAEMFKRGDFEIMLIPENRKVIIEVERKVVWEKSGEWQGWRTISIPCRKNRSESGVFVMVNKGFDTIASIPTSRILSASVTTKGTIYTKREEFFDVPVSLWRFYRRVVTRWSQFFVSA